MPSPSNMTMQLCRQFTPHDDQVLFAQLLKNVNYHEKANRVLAISWDHWHTLMSGSYSSRKNKHYTER